MILDRAKIHGRDAVEQLHQAFIPLCYGTAELVAVDVKVIKQTCKAALRNTALGGFLDMAGNPPPASR